MGNVGLAIRMALYAISSFLAGQGIAHFDPQAGTITFELESLALAIGGAVTFIGTFLVSRTARTR